MKNLSSIGSKAGSAALLSLLLFACSSATRELDPSARENTDGTGDETGNTEESENKFKTSDAGSASDTSTAIGSECATATATTTREPLIMEFVLDGSGSMGPDGAGGPEKWAAAASALTSVFDELGKQNDPNLKIGLVVYADAKDCSGGSGPYPGKGTTSSKCIPDVAPAAVNAAQLALLKGRITGTSPNGSTPTYEALEGGYKVLRAVAGTGKKVLVLMSDGVPSSNQGQSGCITLVGSELKKNPSIQTFSVGIGPFPAPSGLFASYDPEFMSRLALAGGTKANPTCSTNATNVANVCHFQVTPGSNAAASTKLKQDFVDAINKVRGLAIGCEYKLENNGGGAINPNKVNVVWTDGSGKETFVPKNAQNGWSYDDDQNPTKVILHGTSCSDATEDLQSSVKVVIGCDTKT